MSGDPFSTRALIFANGDLNDGPAVLAALAVAAASAQNTPPAIIGVDGGARLALACKLVPTLVIGDMDSLTPEEVRDLEARGAVLERAQPHKDETDLELALLAVADRGVRWARILGAVGDRLDQTLANVYLLALPELVGRDVRMVAGRQTSWVIGPGTHALHGAPGDTISLVPLAGEVTGVRTHQLEYPLRGETLRFGPARGVSNVMLASEAAVTVERGQLLAVHTVGRA